VPSTDPDPKPARTVHIAPDETLNPDRFIAHVEGRQDIVEEAPNSFATAAEAVTWGRERAPVVLIRLPGEGFYRSAGERPLPARPNMPRWPPEGDGGG
jgi:hypothetical protein